MDEQKSKQGMEEMWGEQVVVLCAEDAKRGQLFSEGNYAMFIHWGPYSNLANKVDGKTYYGIGEWIMHPRMAGIPVDDYKVRAAAFNSVEFDADAIAQLAKDAGMKYIVITSKHHDGFAMYHSRADGFNIIDADVVGRICSIWGCAATVLCPCALRVYCGRLASGSGAIRRWSTRRMPRPGNTPCPGDVTAKGNKLYLSIFAWPTSGRLYLPGLKSEMVAARLLMGDRGESISYEKKRGWIWFALPPRAPERLVSVVEVELDGAPDADPIRSGVRIRRPVRRFRPNSRRLAMRPRTTRGGWRSLANGNT
jgi:hypothetical protein